MQFAEAPALEVVRYDCQGGRVGVADFVEEEEGEEDILVGVCGEGLGVDTGEVGMGGGVGFEEALGQASAWVYLYLWSSCDSCLH